ncbi:hypothetical protein [Bacillus phage CP-51]|uniref:RNA polymerase sigma-70 region 2 domain-containing protein n=1 Tax=Bacillus phage CP-51 TaxID=1391188 RepID=A0A068EML2_9CAUD|nr:RNA polymerase sigma factor [Bacillus phage CP-51]AID50653.1 hypothetical protein [Bacillus phage CP-51]
MISKPLLFLWVKGSSSCVWHSLIMLRKEVYSMFAVGGIVAEYKYNNEDLFTQLESAETKEEMDDIRGMIYLNNLRLVHTVLNRAFPQGTKKMCATHRITPQDFFSEVSFGLLKAINTFDSSKGFKFATYAMRCMENELNQYLRKITRRVLACLDETGLDDSEEDSDKTLGDIMVVEEKGYSAIMDKEEFDLLIPKLKPHFRTKIRAKVFNLYVQSVREDEPLTQYEIADKLGVAQPTVSKTLKLLHETANDIRRELDESELQRQTS